MHLLAATAINLDEIVEAVDLGQAYRHLPQLYPLLGRSMKFFRIRAAGGVLIAFATIGCTSPSWAQDRSVAPAAPAASSPATQPVVTQLAAPQSALVPSSAPSPEPNQNPAATVSDDAGRSIATAGRMPHDLSPRSMFLGADILVKAVIVSLAFASLATWTIFFAKTVQLSRATRRLRRALARIAEMRTLSEAQMALGPVETVVSSLLRSALQDARRLSPTCEAPVVIRADEPTPYPMMGCDACRRSGVCNCYSYAPTVKMRGSPIFRLICGLDWFDIDGASSDLLQKLDSSRRVYRWLFTGLHILDFPPLTARPALRTTLILALSGCGLLFSFTGVVIAARRLRSYFRSPSPKLHLDPERLL